MNSNNIDLALAPKRHIVISALFVLGAMLAGLVAIYGIAFPLLLPSMTDAFHRAYLDRSLPLIYLHVVGSGIALFISPVQLLIYRSNRILHRYLGRVYFLAVIAGSIGGYYMAWHAIGGFISTLGLSILASLWWSFTLLAVIHARARNYIAHRRWMLRSFALTYAAVTLRLMAPVLSIYLDEVTQSQIVYWLSWSLNLVVVQFWIRKSSALAPLV